LSRWRRSTSHERDWRQIYESRIKALEAKNAALETQLADAKSQLHALTLVGLSSIPPDGLIDGDGYWLNGYWHPDKRARPAFQAGTNLDDQNALSTGEKR